jgi:hypothetical protein
VDHGNGVVMTMNENENRTDELRADIAARRERMLMGEVDEWQSPAPQQSRRQQRSAPMPEQQTDWSGWNRWAEDIVTRTLAAQPTFTKAQVNAIGEALATIRSEIRKEFATEIASLRADMHVQTSIARGEISTLKGEVRVRKHNAA